MLFLLSVQVGASTGFPWKDNLHGLSSVAVRRFKMLHCKLWESSGVGAVGLSGLVQGVVELFSVSLPFPGTSVQNSFLLTVHLCSVTCHIHWRWSLTSSNVRTTSVDVTGQTCHYNWSKHLRNVGVFLQMAVTCSNDKILFRFVLRKWKQENHLPWSCRDFDGGISLGSRKVVDYKDSVTCNLLEFYFHYF